MNKLFKIAAINALGVLTYILLVAGTIFSFDKWMEDSTPEFLQPVVMLMLLVLSVAVVGTLIFARPVMFFLEGSKKEALKLLGYTLGCMAALLILVIALMIAV